MKRIEEKRFHINTMCEYILQSTKKKINSNFIIPLRIIPIAVLFFQRTTLISFQWNGFAYLLEHFVATKCESVKNISEDGRPFNHMFSRILPHKKITVKKFSKKNLSLSVY